MGLIVQAFSQRKDMWNGAGCELASFSRFQENQARQREAVKRSGVLSAHINHVHLIRVVETHYHSCSEILFCQQTEPGFGVLLLSRL